MAGDVCSEEVGSFLDGFLSNCCASTFVCLQIVEPGFSRGASAVRTRNGIWQRGSAENWVSVYLLLDCSVFYDSVQGNDAMAIGGVECYATGAQ